MMRHRHAPILTILVLALVLTAAMVVVGPAAATPDRSVACSGCHSGAASGTVTATPSNASPSPSATYTVSVGIGLTASGNTGYRIAQTDSAGTSTTWTTVYGGPGSQTTWTPSMTAPATPGAYYYKVWTAKGPNNSSGMAKAVTYSITVPAPAATPAITTLTPNHALTGASVVIAGSNLGSGGAVKFGTTTATTTAWSATSVTATVPASLSPGATTVTVTPTGGSASNALAFTVDAPAAPRDTTAPATAAVGLPDVPWCNYAVTITLSATDNSGGSGVSALYYTVDGGAPVPVAGATADVPFTTSGVHHVAFYAKDAAGNAEAVKSATVCIDLSAPQPWAPRSAKVRRGHTATLLYSILDAAPSGDTAGVTVVIKNRAGKVVKQLDLGSRSVNTVLRATFRCSLRPGVYRFVVHATDAAGNAEASAASQTLRVLAPR